MATVALQYAGSAVGGMLGGPLGGILGRAAGGLIGSFADARLFGKGRTTKGPRLDDLTVMGSSEGASIPVVWGRARIAGQVIWATDFEEEATRSAGTGAKGTDAGSDAATTVFLLRELRCRALRGSRLFHRPRLGGWQGDHPRHPHLALLPRRRGPDARRPDPRQGGRRRRTRLSRSCLHRVRAHAARRLRQPAAAALLRGHAPHRCAGNHDPCRRHHPRRDRVRLRHRDRDAAHRPGGDRGGERPHRGGRRRLDGLARPAPGHGAGDRGGGADRRLVRRRFAMRPLRHQARCRSPAEIDEAPCLVGRRPRPRRGASHLARHYGCELRGHAVGCFRHPRHPRSQGARPRGDVLPLHSHGHTAGQHASRSSDRCTRTARLSLARTHIVAARKRRRRRRGGILRNRGELGSAAHDPPLCAPVRRGGRRRRLPPRQ